MDAYMTHEDYDPSLEEYDDVEEVSWSFNPDGGYIPLLKESDVEKKCRWLQWYW